MPDNWTLYDVLDRLWTRRGATSEDEVQNGKDAIEAHQRGLPHSGIVRDERGANADQGLIDRFKDQSDEQVTEAAADGDQDATRERRRRRALAAVEAAKSEAGQSDAPAPVEAATVPEDGS